VGSNGFVGERVASRESACARGPTMLLNANPVVDDFMARSVRRQYIQQASPTGVPSVQCIEGSTYAAPYESRTLARHAAFRARQLPVAMQIHNLHETRRAAFAAAHGCSHEEGRVSQFPKMAAAYLIGQAEAARACNRYIENSSPAEKYMCEAVERVYTAKMAGSGEFTVACTDGQAKGEADLAAERGKAAQFRAKQYSAAQKAGAAYAAKKWAREQGRGCDYEEVRFDEYPRLAGSMRPEFGMYPGYVAPAGNGIGYTGAEVGASNAALMMSVVGPKTYFHVYDLTHAGSTTLTE